MNEEITHTLPHVLMKKQALAWSTPQPLGGSPVQLDPSALRDPTEKVALMMWPTDHHRVEVAEPLVGSWAH